jgi:carboxylate-amine ligase
MRIVSRSHIHAPDPANEERLRAVFDATSPPTLGIEEEVMLLDPATLDLAPRAVEVLDGLGEDPRFALELPASQLEIIVGPTETVADAVAALAAGRRDLAGATAGELRLAAAGLHPFAPIEGELNRGARYDLTLAEHGHIARRQLVFALQVHVAIRGADRALAVHNALRSHLPEIAALAANAPFHGGRDTGLASGRPPISGLLPRQGIPPVLGSWAEYAAALEWVGDPARWWWELRLHPLHGTLELRVPDTQTTVRDAAAVAAVTQCLAVRLADRHDAGEPLPAVPAWRIEENRWRACRYGVEGEMFDLRTGERQPARTLLHALLDDLEPVAERLCCAGELALARGLVERNGAMRMRDAAGSNPDLRRAVEWLSSNFLE